MALEDEAIPYDGRDWLITTDQALFEAQGSGLGIASATVPAARAGGGQAGKTNGKVTLNSFGDLAKAMPPTFAQTINAVRSPSTQATADASVPPDERAIN